MKGTQNSLTALVDAGLVIEKLRVASEVRQSHLVNNGVKLLLDERKISPKNAASIRQAWDKAKAIPDKWRPYLCDPETDDLHVKLTDLEKYVDTRVANLLKTHPAYDWFISIKGIGHENIAKVVALIDIEKADTISALWRYSGYSVEDGQAPRRVKGAGPLHYNSQLRTLCWRVAIAIKKASARGQPSRFYDYYLNQKQNYEARFASQGYKILATPATPWVCTNCGTSFGKKGEATGCCANPQVQRVLREEPPRVIWQGHLENMALRRMIKLFLACLWLVWREKARLPVTEPYAIGKLKHKHFIDPWNMVDR